MIIQLQEVAFDLTNFQQYVGTVYRVRLYGYNTYILHGPTRESGIDGKNDSAIGPKQTVFFFSIAVRIKKKNLYHFYTEL